MKLTHIAARGLVPFPGEVRLDMADLGTARVVALIGANGAGKSTALKCWPGAMYRGTFDQGRLATLSQARDSYREAGIVTADGTPYTIRQTYDHVSGKAEALVLNGDGKPVLLDAKVTTFDEWAKIHLPDPGVFFTSLFARQGAKSPNFLDLSRGDRKATLLRYLGIERYEALAEIARRHERETSEAIRRLEARRDELSDAAGDPEEIQRELESTRTAAARAAEMVATAEARLKAAQDRHAGLLDAQRNRDRALAKRAAIVSRETDLRNRAGNLAKRIELNEQLVADAERIRQKAGELARIETQIERASAQLATAAGEVGRARGAADRAHAAHRDLARSHKAAEGRVSLARSRATDAAVVRKAVEDLPGAREARDAAREAITAAEQVAIDLRDLVAKSTESRIEGLRHGLRELSENVLVEEFDAYAGRVLTTDDSAAAEAASAVTEIPNADHRHRQARVTEASERDDVFRLQGLVDRLPAIEAAEADLEVALGEASDLVARLQTTKADSEAAESAATKAHSDQQHEQRRRAELEDQRSGLSTAAEQLKRLESAETLLGDLRTQAETARGDLAAVLEELDAAPLPPDAEPLPDLSVEEAAVREAKERHVDAAKAVAVRDDRLAEARREAERIAEITGQVQAHHAELQDYARLALDLGKDGLQALEIDAAGPELSELATDLLHRSYGPRFTVSIETTRLDATGKRELEECYVNVVDTEQGTDGDADRLSGGERVLVGEAIRLALTTVSCRRAGLSGVTLVRDETGAALDPDAGPAYVAMLRRAADLIGADRVLFVTHSPELWALADARIEVKDGQLTVVA